MIQRKPLIKKNSLRFLLSATVLLFNIISINAQTKSNELRMTKEEILSAKAVGTNAPGSSNLTGIQVIVIHGDPAAKGLYTILLKVPDHTTIPAHLHPDDRVATVISGTWYFGYGDVFDKSKLKKLNEGSVYTEVENQNHFAMTDKYPVTVQITGYGPSGVTYVNAADDPQKK